ncbi:MAG: disulfide bond chaperone, partial [Verrucomicrobiales bacterium]|nr:disulfide bond chaperone [Verrucomicrobiales bacterium]
VFEAVEAYYRQSEQRPARLFRFDEEDFVMITAQPDCDMPWFLTLDDGIIRHLDETETLSLLEKREYRFECGCSEERYYTMLQTLPSSEIDEMFSEGGVAQANCPRCNAGIPLSRENFDQFLNSADD